MPQSPYAPPAAAVQDPPEILRLKPVSLRLAIAGVWISVALTAAVTMAQFAGVWPVEDLMQAAIIGAIGVGVLGAIAAAVASGLAWARWLYIALYVLGYGMLLLQPHELLALGALDQAMEVVHFALQTGIIALMCTRASRQWFASPYAGTAPMAH
jgi:hypothetical protein